jgi:hypothetical protein
LIIALKKLTGDSTVRKAGSDEISLGDSQSNESNDHTNNIPDPCSLSLLC